MYAMRKSPMPEIARSPHLDSLVVTDELNHADGRKGLNRANKACNKYYQSTYFYVI